MSVKITAQLGKMKELELQLFVLFTSLQQLSQSNSS
jgi:hypothetical protein